MKKKMAAYQVGLLDNVQTALIEQHLRTCSVCQAELAALVQTAQLLKPALQTHPTRDLWPDIATRLKTRNRHVWVPAWRPALAAALVLVLIISSLWLFPLLQPGKSLPLAPAGDGDTVAQVQLAAAWEAPFADPAALSLAMLAALDEDVLQEATH